MIDNSSETASRIARKTTSFGIVAGIAAVYLWWSVQGEVYHAAAFGVATFGLVAGRAYVDGYRLDLDLADVSSPRPTLPESSIPGTTKQRRAITLAVIMLTSLPAVAFVGTQPLGDSHEGVASAESDGHLVFSAGLNNTVEARDSETGDEVWVWTGPNTVLDVKLSPDETTVFATTADGTLHSIDAETGSENWGEQVHPAGDNTYGLGISPDGDTVYTGSFTPETAAVDASSGDVLWTKSADGNIHGTESSQDGDYVYRTVDSTTPKIQKLDAGTGDVVWETEATDRQWSVIESEDGEKVYVGGQDNQIRILDPSTGSELDSVSVGGTVFEIVQSPDAENIYAGLGGGSVKEFDSETLAEAWTFSGFSGDVRGVGVSPSGETVYGGESADMDDQTKAIDAVDGTEIWSRLGNGGESIMGVSGGGQYSGGGESVTVRVTDQDGNPVEQITLEAVRANEDEIEAQLGDDIDNAEEEAERLLQEAKNPEPPDFDSDLIPTESADLYDDPDAVYPTTHNEEEMGITGWTDSPDLHEPRVQFDSGETVHLYAWDPDEGATMGWTDDAVVSSHYGDIDDDATFELTQLDHAGDDVRTIEVDADQTYDVAGIGGGKYDFATVDLPDGYYYVEVQDSDAPGYVIEVGDAASIIETELESEHDRLTEQAQRNAERLEDGIFETQRAVTNESGVAQNLELQEGKYVIQAYQGPNPEFFDVEDASEISVADLREAREAGYDGAIYLSTDTKVVDTRDLEEDEEIVIEVTKIDSEPFADAEEWNDRIEELRNEFLNETTAELDRLYNDRLDDVVRDELEARYESIRPLIDGSDEIREDYLDRSDFESVPTVDELSEDELRDELAHMQAALANQASSGAVAGTETDVGDDVAEMITRLSGAYDEDDVAVVAHWSDGTVEDVDDEYVTVEQTGVISETTEVRVEDFPIEEDDPAEVTFEVQAVGDDGSVDRARDRVINPAFDETAPEIDAVDVSTLRPGSEERVSFELRPDDPTVYGELESVGVIGPDGETIDAEIDDERASFTTAGEGGYSVRATYTDQSGEQFVETFRLRAGPTLTSTHPTVRLSNGGDTVLAGGGIQSARVEESLSGKEIVAVVSADDDAPGQIHVQSESVALDDVSIRVVQGDLEESVDGHVTVQVHTQMNDDALVYRDSRSQPITPDGDTRYGDIDDRGDKQVITTYTDASGELDMEISHDPDWFERQFYSLTIRSPIDLPLIGMLYGAVEMLDHVDSQPGPSTAHLASSTVEPKVGQYTEGEIVPDTASTTVIEVVA